MPAALIIVNPAARAGRPGHSLVNSAATGLRRRGWQVEIQLTQHAGHATELAATSTADLVVAAGGDGTVNEVVSGLLRHAQGVPALAVLPSGTGNDVARLLGVHPPDAALAALNGEHVVAWDVLSIDCIHAGVPVHRHALLFAGAGFVGEVIRHTTPRTKAWFGSSLSYAVGFFRALIRYRSTHLQINGPNVAHDGPLLTALAANAPHAGGGGMRLGPGARMDDGHFNVSLIRSVGRGEIARQFLRLTCGTHIHHPAVNYFPARWLEVKSREPVAVVADGEVIGMTPARFELRPRAIQIYRSPHVTGSGGL